jgi:hypothetical protein
VCQVSFQLTEFELRRTPDGIAASGCWILRFVNGHAKAVGEFYGGSAPFASEKKASGTARRAVPDAWQTMGESINPF